MFNPRARLSLHPLFGPHCVVILDDALAEPERWVERASLHARAFTASPHNAYPGIELTMPDAIVERFKHLYESSIASHLAGERVLQCHARLALVTKRSSELGPPQWICHRDRLFVPPDQCVAACVTYLFHVPQLGGTSFFQPKVDAQTINQLVHDSGALPAADFAARYGIDPGYMRQSNAWFSHLSTIPPRFNRMIFYDGGIFHSSDIPNDTLLSADPSRGRLTLNAFFTCRRRSAAGGSSSSVAAHRAF